MTWYCQDHVQPVTLSVSWTSPYAMKAVTSAPINSTATLWVEPNRAGPYVQAGSAHVAVGHDTTINYTISTPANYVIGNVGDSGQTWYGPGGGTLPYCRSPIRTLL